MEERMKGYLALCDVIEAYEMGSSEGRRKELGPSNLPWSEVIRYEPLGHGKYAETYLGTARQMPKVKGVIKLVPASKAVVSSDGSSTEAIWRELRHLRLLTLLGRHRICPNLPMMVKWGRSITCALHPNAGSSTTVRNPCLYMLSTACEYTLVEYVAKHHTQLTEDRWMSIVFQVASALHVIQIRFSMVHGDLHWNNVLIHPLEKPKTVCYVVYGKPYLVPIHEVVVLSDFGKSVTYPRLELLDLPCQQKARKTKERERVLRFARSRWKQNMYIEYKKDLVRFLQLESQWKAHKLPGTPPAQVVQLARRYQKSNKDAGGFLKNEMYVFSDQRIGQKAPAHPPIPKTVDAKMVGSLCAYKGKLAMIGAIESNLVGLVLKRTVPDKRSTRTYVRYKEIGLVQLPHASVGYETFHISSNTSGLATRDHLHDLPGVEKLVV